MFDLEREVMGDYLEGQGGGGGGSAEILPFFKLGRWGKCGSKVETCKAQQLPYFIYCTLRKVFQYLGIVLYSTLTRSYTNTRDSFECNFIIQKNHKLLNTI